jgi:two-component system nitrogen regulation response regulator NtrX
LPEQIQQGRFREDLFYRLNVVPLRVPALRERREDIPVLVENFMSRSAELAGLPPRQLAEDAMAVLQTYDWPGNVRQLRNAVDWILIMVPGEAGDPVHAAMLPPDIGSIAPAVSRDRESQEIMALPLREAREIFERQYLEAQVTRFGGNISRTAAFIGMERSALHRKLRSLGLASGDRQ